MWLGQESVQNVDRKRIRDVSHSTPPLPDHFLIQDFAFLINLERRSILYKNIKKIYSQKTKCHTFNQPMPQAQTHSKNVKLYKSSGMFIWN